MPRNTIFALSSGRPPAAIAVIRVSGPQAHAAGEALVGELPPPRQAALRPLVHPHGHLLDHGLVLRFDAPASATGEDVIELHVHGGRAVADAILDALTSIAGLRVATPGEFTRRAFDNGRIDLTEAEGLADLLEAETESQRRAALALLDGGLKRQIADWQDRLLSLSARAEAAIDYVGDEEETGGDDGMREDCAALAASLAEWLARPRAEPLKHGVRIVVAGPPNSGKSSLLNAIAGEERAIVTAIPGTTRDHIEVPLSLGGVPVLLTDTAGLRESADPVEQIGVARARSLSGTADILLWLGGPADAPGHPRLILLHPRCDLPDRRAAPPETIPISAVTGKGIATLLERIASLGQTLLPAEDAIALNRRHALHLVEARDAIASAGETGDIVLAAEQLRAARSAFDLLTGRAGVEDVLDALFNRFCLGK